MNAPSPPTVPHRRISRRSLIAGAAPAVMIASRAFAQGAAGGVAAAAGQSLAVSIGGSLAKSALGAGVNMAIGQILKAAGLDLNGQAAIAKKLDEIIDRLKTLQDSVDVMHRDLRKQLTKLSYDVAAANIRELIVLNGSLTDSYKALLATAPDGIEGAKQDIQDLSGKDLLLGLNAWHDAMVGSSGQTGLIEAWGKDVHAANMDWHGPPAARAMQAQWDYLDAQQAMTVNFMVEHFNAGKQYAKARETLRQWHANREKQVRLLRGMKDGFVGFTTLDANDQVVSGRFGVNQLPPNCAVATGTGIMWFLTVSDQVAMGASEPEFQVNIAPWMGAVARAAATNQLDAGGAGWQVFDIDTTYALMKFCGGDLGGDADHFWQAMKRSGFQFQLDGDGARIWTATTIPFIIPVRIGRVAMVDGQSWWHPQWDAGAAASLLVGRRMRPGETEIYWYS